MKTLISISFLIVCSIKVYAFGGDHIRVRLNEYLEIKRLCNNHNSTFDSIEVTAYLINMSPVFYTDIPDTLHYNTTINGRQLIFNEKHKVVISEPGDLWLGYCDSWIQGGANYYYNVYNSNRFFGISNSDSPSSFNSHIYYLKPNYKASTDYSWNQIRVGLKYSGLDPIPNGNYCFGDEIKQGLRDDYHYHIDHINWYNNGVLLDHQDSLFTITAPGNYYAEMVSNFGYKYYSDTIKISTYQFAKYTDCIDAQIEANIESKIIGKKGFEDVINKKLNIYPNPVIDVVELNFKTCNEVNANFELFNISGIRLIQKMFHFNKDENSQVQLDLTGISPGIYVLCFDFNGIKKRTKIIKQ